MGINTESVESHRQFAESIAPDVTFLSDLTGEVSESYGIKPEQLQRGYYVIDKNRKLHFQFVATGTLLDNQTGTLLMEVDKMTGNYTGNPDDYTSGGMLVSHEDDGNEVGNHAFDFGHQAQCGANLTLYRQLETHENGILLTFFDSTTSDDGIAMYTDLKENLDEFKSRGIGVIGLNDSKPSKNMEFAKSLDVDGREIIFFYDMNGRTGLKYDVYSGANIYNLGKHEIAYFIIDKEGVIQYKHTGSLLENQTDTLIGEIDALIAP